MKTIEKSVTSALTMQIFLILALSGFVLASYRILIIYNNTILAIYLILALIYIYIIAVITVKAIKNIIYLVFFMNTQNKQSESDDIKLF